MSFPYNISSATYYSILILLNAVRREDFYINSFYVVVAIGFEETF